MGRIENQPLDRRSVPFEQFQPLIHDDSIQWHNLQYDTPTPSGLIDHGTEMTNFAATADVIDSLDLIITIDSAIAHLAGAMGKPVWIILNFAADWRWGLDKNRTPWYPSAQLFRQAPNQPWSSVMANIQTTLHAQKTGDPKATRRVNFPKSQPRKEGAAHFEATDSPEPTSPCQTAQECCNSELCAFLGHINVLNSAN